MKLSKCHIVSSRDGLLCSVIASVLTAQRSTTAARGAARAADTIDWAAVAAMSARVAAAGRVML